MTLFALFLALFWGIFWALVLQYVPFGRFLVRQRTWLTVVIGIGGDLAILALVLDAQTLGIVGAIVGASAIGIIIRSLGNEMRDWFELMEMHDKEQDRQ